MEIRPPGFLIRVVNRRKCGSVRCSGGDASIAPLEPHRPMDDDFHQNDPDGNRTPDVPLVGRALYPTELVERV